MVQYIVCYNFHVYKFGFYSHTTRICCGFWMKAITKSTWFCLSMYFEDSLAGLTQVLPHSSVWGGFGLTTAIILPSLKSFSYFLKSFGNFRWYLDNTWMIFMWYLGDSQFFNWKNFLWYSSSICEVLIPSGQSVTNCRFSPFNASQGSSHNDQLRQNNPGIWNYFFHVPLYCRITVSNCRCFHNRSLYSKAL
jgi:hypothetical protein